MTQKRELQFREPSEHESQAAVVAWAKENESKWPELKLLYAIPNGYNKSMASAIKAKKEGLRAGIPDLCLPVARGPFIGLYIEMKKKKGVISPAQQGLIELLKQNKHQVYVARSAIDAIAVIKTYMWMSPR